jgi:hypothetical protein
MHPSQQRPVLAWLLLVAFAAGGVIAPTAHRIQHAGGHGEGAGADDCHIAAAHRADDPVVSENASAERVLDCTACNARLVVAPPPRAAALPLAASISSLSIPTSSRPSATAPTSNLIRGPPVA